MDIIKSAAVALRPISERGIRVAQGWYDENYRTLHVTLWLLDDSEGGHSDDEADVLTAQIQVNIWSDQDQIALKQEIKLLMKQHHFTYLGSHDELETDTKIFTNAMRFQLTEETEEITHE